MADVVLTLDGKEAGAVRAFLALSDAQKKVELQAMRNANAVARGGRKQKQALGAVTGELKGMVLQYASVGAAVAAVTAGIKRLAEADAAFRRQRGERIMEAEPALRRLSQVAESPAEMNRLVKMAKGIAGVRGRGAGMALGPAADIAFQLKSAGQLGLAPTVKDLFRITGTPEGPGELITGARRLQQGFGLPKDAIRRIFNQLIAGAAPVSGLGMREMGEAAQIPAPSMAQIGGTLPETLAGVGVLGGTMPIQMARTRMMRLAESLGKGGVEGAGFAGKMETLMRRQLSERQLRRFMPEQRARAGYITLSRNWELFRQYQEQIEAAGAATGRGDLLARKVQLAQSVPELREAERKRQAQRMGETAGGRADLIMDAAFANIAGRVRGGGGNIFRRFAAYGIESWGEFPGFRSAAEAWAQSPTMDKAMDLAAGASGGKDRLVAAIYALIRALNAQTTRRNVHVEGGD